MKLDYTARRPDGRTISDLRASIINEDAQIADLEKRIASCRENRADAICRLSTPERQQLALDNQNLFPNGLPTIDEIPYLGEPTAQLSKRDKSHDNT